jgi:nicotinamidase/pyrazinamidase
MISKPQTKSCLVLVDLQNDFMPGGALAVKEGDKVLPAIGKLLQMPFDYVVATKDWHPLLHCSFASTHHLPIGDRIEWEGVEQILWPDHCVQNTQGAEFYPGWRQEKIDKVFYKGTDIKMDSYSTFFDNQHRRSTGLTDFLKEHQVSKIFLAGLATDYCVKFSALDAKNLGFETYVVKEGCKAVRLKKGDEEGAWSAMKSHGVEIISLSDVEKYL